MTPITISVNDAIALSGLSRDTIYRLIRRGALASTRVGTRRLIDRASLVALLRPIAATTRPLKRAGNGDAA